MTWWSSLTVSVSAGEAHRFRVVRYVPVARPVGVIDKVATCPLGPAIGDIDNHCTGGEMAVVQENVVLVVLVINMSTRRAP